MTPYERIVAASETDRGASELQIERRQLDVGRGEINRQMGAFCHWP